MTRKWIIAAGIFGFVAVALGAFATHGIDASPRALAAIDTGADYALFHAAVLLAWAALGEKAGRFAGLAGWTFVIGVALFSGSLFVFGLTEITSHLWMTPIGGVFLLAGWALIVMAGIAKAPASP